MYVNIDDNKGSGVRMHLFSEVVRLATYGYRIKAQNIGGDTGNSRGDFGIGTLGAPFLLNGQGLKLTPDTWVTLELYID